MNFEIEISYYLPKLEIQIQKGKIIIDGNKIVFNGNFLPEDEDVKRIAESIEDNFWEYQIIKPSEKEKDILTKLEGAMLQVYSPNLYFSYKAYSASGVLKVNVDYENNTLLIALNDKAVELAGRFIGKGGEKIKKLQEILKMKVKIITETSTKEEDELKKKMEDLLKRLV